jgi:hypothetical protein
LFFKAAQEQKNKLSKLNYINNNDYIILGSGSNIICPELLMSLIN